MNLKSMLLALFMLESTLLLEEHLRIKKDMQSKLIPDYLKIFRDVYASDEEILESLISYYPSHLGRPKFAHYSDILTTFYSKEMKDNEGVIGGSIQAGLEAISKKFLNEMLKGNINLESFTSFDIKGNAPLNFIINELEILAEQRVFEEIVSANESSPRSVTYSFNNLKLEILQTLENLTNNDEGINPENLKMINTLKSKFFHLETDKPEWFKRIRNFNSIINFGREDFFLIIRLVIAYSESLPVDDINTRKACAERIVLLVNLVIEQTQSDEQKQLIFELLKTLVAEILEDQNILERYPTYNFRLAIAEDIHQKVMPFYFEIAKHILTCILENKGSEDVLPIISKFLKNKIKNHQFLRTLSNFNTNLIPYLTEIYSSEMNKEIRINLQEPYKDLFLAIFNVNSLSLMTDFSLISNEESLEVINNLGLWCSLMPSHFIMMAKFQEILSNTDSEIFLSSKELFKSVYFSSIEYIAYNYQYADRHVRDLEYSFMIYLGLKAEERNSQNRCLPALFLLTYMQRQGILENEKKAIFPANCREVMISHLEKNPNMNLWKSLKNIYHSAKRDDIQRKEIAFKEMKGDIREQYINSAASTNSTPNYAKTKPNESAEIVDVLIEYFNPTDENRAMNFSMI
jgi:hypothetical protein